MNRAWQKLSFFALLYFVQGAAFAYLVNFQKPYLMEKGLTKDSIGLFTSLLLIPFILKVFLGMLSDRVPLGRWGARKPYMLIGLGLFALGYSSLPEVDPSLHFVEFALFSFLASIGLALFDTCCDGWAIDVAIEEEQSSVQAAMVAGRSLGFIAASIGFGGLALHYGYGAVFYTLAVMAMTVAGVVVIVKHRPMDGGQLEPIENVDRSHFRQWLRPEYLLFAAYGVIYSIASFGTDGLLTLHLAETKMAGVLELGVFGTGRGVGALVGAYMFARFAQKYPLRHVLRLGLGLLGFGCLLPLVELPLGAAGGLWGVAWGFQETAYVTLAMSFSRGPWAATFFAICMIFSNVGTSLGEAIAAPAAGKFSYHFVFLGFAILAWLLMIAVPRLVRWRAL